MDQPRPQTLSGITPMYPEIEIIALTMPVEVDGSTVTIKDLGERESNTDYVITDAGRTCYQTNDRATAESDQKLLGRMAASGHLSVLEHASVVFRIRGISRACTHQLVRHRHMSISQESQRYCDEGNFGFIIPPSISQAGLDYMYVNMMRQARENYLELQDCLKKAVKEGRLSKPHGGLNEDARFVLPNAVQSEIVIGVNFTELRHIFAKRLTTHAQWEIFNLAELILNTMFKISRAFDDMHEHFAEHGNLNDFGKAV